MVIKYDYYDHLTVSKGRPKAVCDQLVLNCFARAVVVKTELHADGIRAIHPLEFFRHI